MTENEIWRPLAHKGFETTHEISSKGRIRRLIPTKFIKEVPYYLKYTMYKGSVIAKLYGTIKSDVCYIARDLLKSFGVEKTGKSIIYKDKNPYNLSLSNLAWGDQDVARKSRACEVKKRITPGKSCEMCVRHPDNYIYTCGVSKCNITGIKKFKTNFAECGCVDYIKI